MNWEIVIGLETHAQLSTQSKIFSPASTAFGAAPNTQASAIDLALPGTLPVLNRGAVERAIRFGLAIDATINRRSIFARKNYFYPDLPKGYQISQYELPIVQGGTLEIDSPSRGRIKIRLTRAHLEEDAGKSIHGEALSSVVGSGVVGRMVVGKPESDDLLDLSKVSGIDLNRAGTPLLEIVSEPDLRSPEEAVAYAKKLHELVQWYEICDGNMQEGSFRCDANVSVRRPGGPLGTRREIKNLNSFRFLQQAIEYEVQWQIATLEDGGKIEQATVLFDSERGETRMMRTKEDAHDYRYFPDPDLLPLHISDSWIEEIRSTMPASPEAKRGFYKEKYGLTDYDADQIVSSRDKAEFYEQILRDPEVSAVKGAPKYSANLMLGELSALINKEGMDFAQSPVTPKHIAKITARTLSGTISTTVGRGTIATLWSEPLDVDELIDRNQLRQVTDAGEIERLVDEVIAANSAQVADYRNGKEKAFNSLVGQVMKASKGKANPAQVNEILKRKLG